MNRIIFSGASDDLLHVVGEGRVFGAEALDETYPSGISKRPVMGKFVIDGRITVYAIYDGNWGFAPVQTKEGDNLEKYGIEHRANPEVPYCLDLIISSPAPMLIRKEW